MYPLTIPVAIASIQKLQNFALQPMEISKQYNSVPVKDNCALFAPTPNFRVRAMQWCHVNFSPEDPVVMATNRFYSKTKLAAGSQERQTLKRSC